MAATGSLVCVGNVGIALPLPSLSPTEDSPGRARCASLTAIPLGLQSAKMRQGISISAVGPGGDPRTMAQLAAAAEDAGWDAVFLEDYIVYPGTQAPATYDPWLVLAAMAVATKTIRLGTLVTPITRRRPWKLAMEATTLDHLSDGRVILGLGAGEAAETSFAAVHESASQRDLAAKLDESLEILARLFEGTRLTFHGAHYRIDRLQLLPRPVQRPRIPIWVGGDWLLSGVRRRLTRWDGTCAYHGKPGTPESRPLDAGEVRDLRAWVERQREGGLNGYDICVGGRPRDTDLGREHEYLGSLAEAGATWWQEWPGPGDASRVRRAVLAGPLPI